MKQQPLKTVTEDDLVDMAMENFDAMEGYEPGDEFDWDRNDQSQYCKHGTLIGSWWGPDLLCVACELGDPETVD